MAIAAHHDAKDMFARCLCCGGQRQPRHAGGDRPWQAGREYILPDDAESVTLVIKQGERIVARSTGEVTAGSHEFEWDGKSENGADLEDGVYTLDVIATNADGESITAEIRASGRVTGVDMSGSEVIVQMGNISVPLSSILAVREDGSETVDDII